MVLRLTTVLVAGLVAGCLGQRFDASARYLGPHSPNLVLTGQGLDQVTGINFNSTDLEQDVQWRIQHRHPGWMILELLTPHAWHNETTSGASLAVTGFTADGQGLAEVQVQVAILVPATTKYVAASPRKIAATAENLTLYGGGFSAGAVQLRFVHAITQGGARVNNFTAHAISEYQIEARLNPPGALEYLYPMSEVPNRWGELPEVGPGFEMELAWMNGTEIGAPVKVGQVVRAPRLEPRHHLVHPRSPELVLHGHDLDCDLEPEVLLNIPALQGAGFHVGYWNSTRIQLVLHPGKDWLNGSYGSMAIQVTELGCNQVITQTHTEVAVLINSCVAGQDGTSCLGGQFRGGLFVGEGTNRTVRQYVAQLNATLDLIAPQHLHEFSAGIPRFYNAYGMTVDPNLGRLYLSVGADPGDEVGVNILTDVTGAVLVFNPTTQRPGQVEQAKIGNRPGKGRIRSPRGLALQNLWVYRVDLMLIVDFASSFGAGAGAELVAQTKANLLSDMRLVLELPGKQVQLYEIFEETNVTTCHQIHGTWDDEYKIAELGSTTAEPGCTRVSFRVVTDSVMAVPAMAARLEADVRNQTGQFNRKHRHHKYLNNDFKYRGRVWFPEFVSHLVEQVAERRKFLYVASDAMHCVVRLSFDDPDDPDSGAHLAPDPLTHLSPYTCDTQSGKCFPFNASTPQIEKVCIDQKRDVRACDCENDDSCLWRDSELCWSEIGGSLSRPLSARWTSADWDRLYVSSEDSGRILQLDLDTGLKAATTPKMADHLMGLGLDGYRHDYGLCRDSNADGLFHCSGAGSVEEGSNMPVEIPRYNCAVDSECKPARLNRTFVVAESAAMSCDYQAILRMANLTERDLDEEGVPTETEYAGRVVLDFDGWLKDAALKKSTVSSLQFHSSLGILVAAGSRILRYDPHTGELIQTLADVGPMGEITCFQVE